MMPKVEATNACKIQSIFKEFPEKFMKIPPQRIAICATVRFPAANFFFVDSHGKTSKHQTTLGSRSEQLIPTLC